MESYNVVNIETNEVVVTYQTYDECLKWIDTYGNIVEYTIKSSK
jgi:hypothetical protein